MAELVESIRSCLGRSRWRIAWSSHTLPWWREGCPAGEPRSVRLGIFGMITVWERIVSDTWWEGFCLFVDDIAATDSFTWFRVRGNHLDKLILFFNGVLLFCNGLFQLWNRSALSGKIQILFHVFLILSPNSLLLLLKSLHHFCLEIVKQLFHPLLLLRDASFKAFPWWLHTFSLLEIGFSLNGDSRI